MPHRAFLSAQVRQETTGLHGEAMALTVLLIAVSLVALFGGLHYWRGGSKRR